MGSIAIKSYPEKFWLPLLNLVKRSKVNPKTLLPWINPKDTFFNLKSLLGLPLQVSIENIEISQKIVIKLFTIILLINYSFELFDHAKDENQFNYLSTLNCNLMRFCDKNSINNQLNYSVIIWSKIFLRYSITNHE